MSILDTNSLHELDFFHLLETIQITSFDPCLVFPRVDNLFISFKSAKVDIEKLMTLALNFRISYLNF